MGDIKFQPLIVEGVESNNGRIIIKSGGKSYSFFQSKQDGTKSRAQSDFERLGVSIGKTYSFGITETQGTNSKTGAPIVFRNIATISETRDNPQSNVSYPQDAGTYQSDPSPTVQLVPEFNITRDEWTRMVNAVNALNRKLGELDKQVHGLRMMNVDQGKEDGQRFHEDTQDMVEQNKADQIPTIDLDEEIKTSDTPF